VIVGGDHLFSLVFFGITNRMGAQQTDEMEVEKEKFGGSGFRLGNDSSRPGEKIEAPKKPQTVTKVITFYKQGFTVNDGPLRRFEDPENSKFLEDVNQVCVAPPTTNSDMF
jgi:hypothetical protein